jgi:tetratricopeptide (TPR) repeat protein
MRGARLVLYLLPLVAALGLRATAAGGSLNAEPELGERAPHSASWVRDRDIEFYEARIARDPLGAMDRMRLAALYLQRGTATGSEADFSRAEAAASASLEHRRAHNEAALAVLAGARMGRHRFVEARDAARELVARAPESAAARALLAEALLELGAYTEAGDLFRSLGSGAREPSVLTRLARWHELEGRVELAGRLLREARDRALQLHGLPPEQRAWFHLRVADFALRYGRLHEAAAALKAGLGASPKDHRLLAARARLAFATGNWEQAVRDGEGALAAAFDPATLGLLADAYAAMGDTASAARLETVMDMSLLGQPGPFHRGWSLHLLDRRRHVPEVLRRAEEELRVRRDVYGWDVYAWALQASGRNREAATAMDSALAPGTRDPLLLQHARVIQRAVR